MYAVRLAWDDTSGCWAVPEPAIRCNSMAKRAETGSSRLQLPHSDQQVQGGGRAWRAAGLQ